MKIATKYAKPARRELAEIVNRQRAVRVPYIPVTLILGLPAFDENEKETER